MLRAAVILWLASLSTLQDWERADRETERLPPAAFPSLPPDIRTDLERRGCTIPQPFGGGDPRNVISGAFTRAGDVDWAILCSVRRVSTILVYRAGSIRNVDRIGTGPDSAFLQVVTRDRQGNPVAGYSRAIVPADAKHIMEHHRDFGGPRPPPLDHDRIEDNFVEKGSSILYWHRGRWLTLTGMD
jgi:hypothetical protein